MMVRKKLNLRWQFPLRRAHCGVLLGNGLFGAIVWGNEKLCITINRADFWDHRNHMPVTEEFNYAKLRRIWEVGDEEAMDNLALISHGGNHDDLQTVTSEKAFFAFLPAMKS